jgi:hypothetical protein
VLNEYPREVVDKDNAVIFSLDGNLNITYCNAAWDRFALANSGQHLCLPAPIGRCVLDYIGEPDREYFAKHYERAIRQSEPWERDYECSSANVYRKFRLRAVPLRKTAGLFVMNSLIVEHPHRIAAAAPVHESYRRADGFIVMCASCRRTRRSGRPERWDWVPAFVDECPPEATHGVCLLCRELYYPDE